MINNLQTYMCTMCITKPLIHKLFIFLDFNDSLDIAMKIQCNT